MQRVTLWFRIGPLVLLVLVTKIAVAQLEPKCVENSPERRGEFGCSYIENKPLPETLKEPLYWHIDKFDSGEHARAAVGSAGVAFQAHGTWWLFTIESAVDNHHGGEHVTQVELPALPSAKKYAMLVYSAYIPPGLTSRVHHHSGPEAFYVVEGEQCLETEARAYPMHKGDTLVIPTGVTMQLVATGSIPRRSFAVVVYDASQAPTTRMENGPPLVPCK
jgi:quercetin dioxygenase-like cupin family protein